MNDWLTFKQMVVWDKGKMGMGWHYRRSYEVVLVGHKGQKCNWYDDSDSVENIIRPNDYGIRKIIPQSDDHPTPKPWQLPAHFVKLHTQPGDTVLDPFMGGGSTAEACQMIGRRFIGVELEKQWADIAVARLSQMNLFEIA
jgi:DNA modification methylase